MTRSEMPVVLNRAFMIPLRVEKWTRTSERNAGGITFDLPEKSTTNCVQFSYTHYAVLLHFVIVGDGSLSAQGESIQTQTEPD